MPRYSDSRRQIRWRPVRAREMDLLDTFGDGRDDRGRPSKVTIYNPLPRVLAHYVDELESVIRGCDSSALIDIVTTENEGLSGLAKWTALARHVWTSRRLLRQKGPIIVVWPLLGWYELWLLKTSRADVYVIVHDPKPLRPQVGLSERAARRTQRWKRSQPAIISHSSIAKEHTASLVPGARIVTIPHPLLQDAPERRPASDGSLRLLVGGQYKPARDISLLEELGQRLSQINAVGEIKGPNWPVIPGWSVESRFLTEDELTSSITSSDVVLIPYKHYYQSNIAARAVENGVAVAGRRHPFLEELLGPDYPGLVEGNDVSDWVDALFRLRSSTAVGVDRRAAVVDAWRPIVAPGRP